MSPEHLIGEKKCREGVDASTKGQLCFVLENVFRLRNGGNKRDTNLLVNHQCQNAHHRCTTVVQFNGALAKLGGIIKGIPSKINEVVSQVTLINDKVVRQVNAAIS